MGLRCAGISMYSPSPLAGDGLGERGRGANPTYDFSPNTTTRFLPPSLAAYNASSACCNHCI